MTVSVLKGLGRPFVLLLLLLAIAAAIGGAARPLLAQPLQQAQVPQERGGGEASLVLPDLSTVDFLGVNGRTLLMGGLIVCALGLLFGLATFTQLKNLPVHASMLEVSELIYETCKTYLITQGKFILILWLFIASIISAYYGWLNPVPLTVLAAAIGAGSQCGNCRGLPGRRSGPGPPGRS